MPNLEHDDWTAANLSTACLTDANLSGAFLKEAKLSKADLSEADLSAANLVKAIRLTQAQIDLAQGDEKTKLPPNLERPAHWSKGDEE